MNRFLIILVVSCFVSSSAELLAQQKPTAARKSRTSPLEQRFAEAYQTAAPSVVRVSWKHHRNIEISRSGVIFTADGYVATTGFDPAPEPEDLQPGKAVSIHLADGRMVEGRAVTSSLHFGIVKIVQNGKWPHVVSGSSATVNLGDWCLAAGYDAPPMDDVFTIKPSLHVGRISAKGEQRWLGTTHRSAGVAEGSSLFNLQGRLIGIYTAAETKDAPDRIFFSADSLKENWNTLIVRDRSFQDALLGDDDRGAPVPSPDDPELDPAATEAAQYTVRIDRNGPGVSGTLVSRDGHIATCAHHLMTPGTDVTIHLPHYLSKPFSVRGKVLGSDPLLDIGLVQITDTEKSGPWRHAQFANASKVNPGDLCLALGYPEHLQKKGPFCQTRSGRVISTWFAPNQLESSCQTAGGMSGGGLYDTNGRLIGVHTGGYNYVDSWHRTSDLFRQHWTFLLKGPETVKLSPFEETEPAKRLQRKLSSAEKLAVDVLPLKDDGHRVQRPVALGTMVSSDGHFLTKASSLYGDVRCRFADGQLLPAKIVKLSRELDLALLKVNGKHLPRVCWSETDGKSLGQFVAVASSSQSIVIGTVSQPVHEVQNVQGWLVVGKVKNGDGGVEVQDMFGYWKEISPLMKGDVITHVEDRETPNLRAFEKITVQKGVGWGVTFVNAGDPVRVGILRDGKKQELRFPFLHPHWDRSGTKSPRCGGFNAVFDVEVSSSHIPAKVCGGPVTNDSGQVVGITIARAGPNRLFVVPASVARKFVADHIEAED